MERIFGVVKHRWTILTRTPHYDMATQSKIPSALIALHNFILEHDETDLDRWLGDPDALDNLMGLRRDEQIDFWKRAHQASNNSRRNPKKTRPVRGLQRRSVQKVQEGEKVAGRSRS